MATSDTTPAFGMSKITPASEVAIQWFREVWSNRNSEAIVRLMAPDAKGRLEGGIEVNGREQFQDFHRNLLHSIPDLSVRLLRLMSDEKEACLHWEASGTHSGYGFGLKPTGRQIHMEGMTWLCVEDGIIVKGWDCWNLDRFFKELAGQ